MSEWVKDNGSYYYYYSDGTMATGWQELEGYWYYFYSDGSMTWSNEVDGYYLGADGRMVTDEKWVNTEEDNSGTWYYVGAHEKVVTGWNKIGNDFHYFNHPGGSMTWSNTIDGFDIDSDGKIVSGTGWLKDEYSGNWYYFSDGKMKTGWIQDGDSWYYLKADGTMATGMQDIAGDTYYFYSDGKMGTGWEQDRDNIWHYFYGDGNGSMAHDTTIGGYHVDKSGKMITGTGWVPSDGSWYYLKDDGEVATNWQYINDNWYYFYKEEGSMAHATTIDGYYLNDDGEWAPNDNSDSLKLAMGLGSLKIDESKLGTGDVGNFKGLENPTLDEILERIPSYAKNVGFDPEPGRIENGFKFEWKDPDTGYDWTAWGHEIDPVAVKEYPESNAANGWTWRVRYDTPTGRPYFWNSKTQEFDKDNKNGRANKSNDTHNPMKDPTVVKKDDDDDSNSTGGPGNGDIHQDNAHKEGEKCVDEEGNILEFRNGQWENTGEKSPKFITPINPNKGSMPDIEIPDMPMIPEILPVP